MDFDDTPPQAKFRREVRSWLDEHVPKNLELGSVSYKDDIRPFRDWQKRKADAGWARVQWPPEYGGRGGSAIEEIIWNQEEGELALLSSPFIIGLGMAGPVIMQHGSDSQRKRYLPPMICGQEIWCQLFSEPAAGSDLAGIRTRAVRTGDEWVINGQKIWTSYAHVADFGILITRTDAHVPKHKGLSFFIVDMKSPGIEIRPIRMASGDADFNEVFLSDVQVPDACRIGKVGEGWLVALTTLMNERLSVGSAFPTNFDDIFKLAVEISGDHGPLVEDSAIREQVAEWFIKSNGLKYTNLRMISALARGGMPGPEASITKLVLGRGRQQLASLALDMQGTAGVQTDSEEAPLAAVFQKLFLRSVGNRLEGGTDEILLNIIGERVLGLPPDARVDKDLPFNEVPSGKFGT